MRDLKKYRNWTLFLTIAMFCLTVWFFILFINTSPYYFIGVIIFSLIGIRNSNECGKWNRMIKRRERLNGQETSNS